MRYGNDLINKVVKSHQQEVREINLMRDHIPDYDYLALNYSMGKLYILVNFSDLAEIVNAFMLLGWSILVDAYQYQVQIAMEKTVAYENETIKYQAFISVATYEDGVKAIKEICGDRVEFR